MKKFIIGLLAFVFVVTCIFLNGHIVKEETFYDEYAQDNNRPPVKNISLDTIAWSLRYFEFDEEFSNGIMLRDFSYLVRLEDGRLFYNIIPAMSKLHAVFCGEDYINIDAYQLQLSEVMIFDKMEVVLGFAVRVPKSNIGEMRGCP